MNRNYYNNAYSFISAFTTKTLFHRVILCTDLIFEADCGQIVRENRSHMRSAVARDDIFMNQLRSPRCDRGNLNFVVIEKKKHFFFSSLNVFLRTLVICTRVF